MADADTNVTALRPKAKDVTGALRANRLRRKPKARPATTAPVPTAKIAQLEKLKDIKADVTVDRRDGHAADVTAAVAAIALAGAAA